MTLNMTGSVLSVPFSLLLMTLVMPYNKLSQIVGGSQLISSNELSIIPERHKSRLPYPRYNYIICYHSIFAKEVHEKPQPK